jgi:hypothetical protein
MAADETFMLIASNETETVEKEKKQVWDFGREREASLEPLKILLNGRLSFFYILKGPFWGEKLTQPKLTRSKIAR